MNGSGRRHGGRRAAMPSSGPRAVEARLASLGGLRRNDGHDAVLARNPDDGIAARRLGLSARASDAVERGAAPLAVVESGLASFTWIRTSRPASSPPGFGRRAAIGFKAAQDFNGRRRPLSAGQSRAVRVGTTPAGDPSEANDVLIGSRGGERSS
ncbi:MAG: hypothetical protein KGM24_09945 [Elusimicrobia bacterium]|nr:hypothetical protein [Elusimicrobiota bacterium]